MMQALYALDFNNANETGIRQSSKGNPALTWESQKSTDVAVEFAFFNHRLRGSFELYHRNSDGLIFSVQLPLSQGGYFIPQNIGAMKNTGYEASLTYEVVRKEKFNWSVTANATTVKNEITRMPVGQEEIIDGTKKLKVGQSIYDYWLIEYMGVNPQTGQAQYRAADESAAGVYTVGKDVLTTNHNNGKFHYAGSAIPDLYGSFVNTIRYGNFELSAMLTFQLGGKIYDGTYASLMHTGQYGRAMHKDALNAWKQPGDITEVPALNNAAVTASTLSRWLTDASYLNLRNINLSYAVPAKWAEKAGAAGATVFLNGSNLVWITERKGMNPQQSYTGVTSNNAVPARIVSAGINVNF